MNDAFNTAGLFGLAPTGGGEPPPVPEPATLLLFLFGAAAVGLRRSAS